MTDKQTPPDWVLIEAAKRAGLKRSPAQLRAGQIAGAARPDFRALCDMIERCEAAPVDRKVLCAREAISGTILYGDLSFPEVEANRKAMHEMCIRAIELFEEGFGK